MSKKIAVAVVHGVGKQKPTFANSMVKELKERLKKPVEEQGGSVDDFVFQAIYWAPALQKKEDELWKRLKAGGDMDFLKLRRFMIDFAGDAIAYQPTLKDRAAYDATHLIVARSLANLAKRAGTDAPLCVISHSLGTVIMSNYLYDLGRHTRRRRGTSTFVSPKVARVIGSNPLERGETLSTYYTMGSPIAIWSMRYKDFGLPINVPSARLGAHHSGIKGEWINFYDEDDVIGYPLSKLNKQYGKMVKDRSVNVGGILTHWNPVSHGEYWTDNDVTKPIASSLLKVWKESY
ncbi:MAG: chemotaxis protein [Deltaproteobacteria bacterium]|nr:chemotaxis protein [Deltaproteobacteria bacterium]